MPGITRNQLSGAALAGSALGLALLTGSTSNVPAAGTTTATGPVNPASLATALAATSIPGQFNPAGNLSAFTTVANAAPSILQGSQAASPASAVTPTGLVVGSPGLSAVGNVVLGQGAATSKAASTQATAAIAALGPATPAAAQAAAVPAIIPSATAIAPVPSAQQSAAAMPGTQQPTMVPTTVAEPSSLMLLGAALAIWVTSRRNRGRLYRLRSAQPEVKPDNLGEG